MARQQRGHTESDGVARLVDAERGWEQSLETARKDAGELVRAARAEAMRIEEMATAEIARAVKARQREYEAATAAAVSDVENDSRARIARYAEAPAALVDAAATIVADAAPWLSSSGGVRP